jgi:hypothetical protein
MVANHKNTRGTSEQPTELGRGIREVQYDDVGIGPAEIPRKKDGERRALKAAPLPHFRYPYSIVLYVPREASPPTGERFHLGPLPLVPAALGHVSLNTAAHGRVEVFVDVKYFQGHRMFEKCIQFTVVRP